MGDEERRLRVPPSEAGERLDVVLARLLDESRSQAAGRLERGEVRSAAGDVVGKSRKVEGGELVVVSAPPEAPTGAAGVPPPPIRFEDDHLLVVEKPAGLVVHPGAGHPAGTMVQAMAAAGIPLAPRGGEHRPGIVHRLDRDTSGLLVVAKTDQAHSGLVAALKRRDVERRYLALVEGRFDADRVRIEVPLGRDPSSRKRFAARSDGKPAITRVEQIGSGRFEDVTVSLLGCRLETGRTHQIRVHLRHAGHPVVGDATYGGDLELAEKLGLTRLFLHAAALRFRHPVTGVEVALEAPLAQDLRTALDRSGIPGP